MHSGLIEYNCKDCDEQAKKIYGCDDPADEPSWEHDDYKFYSCPRIACSFVLEWYEQYSYDLQMHTAEKFYEQTQRYIEAMRTYNSYLSTMSIEASKMRRLNTGGITPVPEQ